MAVDERTNDRPHRGNRARLLALALLAFMAVLLVVVLFWNPLSVK